MIPLDNFSKSLQAMAMAGVPAAHIEKLFHGAAFHPDELAVLREAYTRACKSLHDKGQPAIVNEIIAQRIIALSRSGERDPDRLSEGALVALGHK